MLSSSKNATVAVVVVGLVLSLHWIYSPTVFVLGLGAHRNKIAKIAPLSKSSSSSSIYTSNDGSNNKKKKNKSSKQKGRRQGSLEATDIHTLLLPQITTLNVTFFQDDDDNSPIVFQFKDSSGSRITRTLNDNEGASHHWYGEMENGLGSITLIQSFLDTTITSDSDNNDSTIENVISRLYGSATVGDTIYSIITSIDGSSILVYTMNTTNFPLEKEEEEDPSSSSSIHTPTTTAISNVIESNDETHDNSRQLSSLRGSKRRTVTSSSSSTSIIHQKNENNTSRNIATKLDDGTILDMLCVYTLETVCQQAQPLLLQGNTTCNKTTFTKYEYLMDSQCQLAVSQTNTAFTNSGVKTRVNLVYSNLYNPNYIENQWWDDNVNTILDTNNPMSSSLFAMREKYAADFVVVVLNNNGACGSNYGGGYIVVNQDCMTGYYSMAHEVGHAMGCAHEATSFGTKPPNGTMFGYVDSNNGFRTIMSIDQSLSRIQYFSNSNTSYTYNQKPIGSSMANCVSTMNANAYTVSNYRQSFNRIIETVATRSPAIATTPRHPTRKPTAKRVFPIRQSRKPTLNPLPSVLSICTRNQNSSCSQSQIPLIIRLDRPQVLSWNVMDFSTNTSYCNGGPYSTTNPTLTYCLQVNRSLRIQLRDTGAVGFMKSPSTYNITIGTLGATSYKTYTKNNGQTVPFWRSHSFTT